VHGARCTVSCARCRVHGVVCTVSCARTVRARGSCLLSAFSVLRLFSVHCSPCAALALGRVWRAGRTGELAALSHELVPGPHLRVLPDDGLAISGFAPRVVATHGPRCGWRERRVSTDAHCYTHGARGRREPEPRSRPAGSVCTSQHGSWRMGVRCDVRWHHRHDHGQCVSARARAGAREVQGRGKCRGAGEVV
jgi:hypothetical protein